jgi:hypothetical protein
MEKVNIYMLELEKLNSANEDANSSQKFEFFRKVLNFVFKLVLKKEIYN